MATHLVVSTHRNYVFEELSAPARVRGLPALHDLGLDVPSLPAGALPAWWVPSGHAVRLLHAGVPLELTAPGPRFLEALPARLRGRPVSVLPLSELTSAAFPAFVKPAESKLDLLPAAWWEDGAAFQVAALAAGLRPDSLVQLSGFLDIRFEFRFLVADGAVLSGAPYRAGDELYFPGISAPRDVFDRARSFAVEVLSETPVPPGLTLDVAVLGDGSAVVLEPNPAWCAYWYDCDPAAALEAVIASTDPARVGPWRYRPDPVLLERAARQRVLARR